MAADTRPYKSKEQDGQGNEVIIRDQQLVEQSTVTTMPSGACFETFDIDGRPVKIPRDNMISIVMECMGIVLNDSSKNLGTNVNKALGLQGNNIGNVTVNDFASVLGVPLYSTTGPSSAIISGLNSAFGSASEYSKFEGTIPNVGYFVGFRGGSEGKAAAILLTPASTYIVHRNWNTSAGDWTMFYITR